MQLAARAVQRNRDQHLRHIECLGDLRIREIFEIAKREDFGGAGVEGCKRAAQAIAHFRGRVRPVAQRFTERDGRRRAAAPQQIERCIHGRTSKIAFLLDWRRGGRVAPQQAQEDRLQNIFSVGGISGDPVCRPEDQPVILLEDSAEFRCVRRNRGLSDC